MKRHIAKILQAARTADRRNFFTVYDYEGAFFCAVILFLVLGIRW